MKLDSGFVYAAKNPGVFTDARCYMHWIASQYGMSMRQGYELPSSCSQSSGRKDDINKPVCRVQPNHYIQKQRFIPCHPKMLQQTRSNVEHKNCTDVGPGPGPANFEEACRSKTISGCLDDVEKHVTEGYCDWSQNDTDGNLWDRCRLVAAEGFSYNIHICKDRYGGIGTCSNNCRGVDPNAIIIGGSAVLAAATAGGLTILQAAGLGAIGAGAIGAGAASVLLNTNQCPHTRPCRVSHIPCICFLLRFSFLQGRDRRNPRRRKCCKPFGTGQGASCGRGPRFC